MELTSGGTTRSGSARGYANLWKAKIANTNIVNYVDGRPDCAGGITNSNRMRRTRDASPEDIMTGRCSPRVL